MITPVVIASSFLMRCGSARHQGRRRLRVLGVRDLRLACLLLRLFIVSNPLPCPSPPPCETRTSDMSRQTSVGRAPVLVVVSADERRRQLRSPISQHSPPLSPQQGRKMTRPTAQQVGSGTFATQATSSSLLTVDVGWLQHGRIASCRGSRRHPTGDDLSERHLMQELASCWA